MFQAIFRNVLVLLVLSASSVTLAFAAENRVALVIGNSAYRHATALANPKNDASDMAAAAEKLGFKVIKGLDLDKSGMDRTIRQFAETLRGASMGLFFYAGHGLQVSGRNYLVPIDAELRTAEALDFEMIGLDVVQRIMEAASETNVLFVDACRDNPLSRNLARAMGTRSTAIGNGLTAQEAGAGTLISFSTQPGNVALDGTGSRNSPYAAALTKHIATQGKDLPAVLVQVRRDVMAATGKRQIPWEHSALTAEVMLGSQAPVRTSANAAPTPKADDSERNANAGASSDVEPKTATGKASEPEGKREAAQQRIVKVGVTNGTLRIINNKNHEYLYTETGRKLPINRNTFEGSMPTNEAVELSPGRYYLKNGSRLMTVKPFDLKANENVVIDFPKHVGTLRIINNKNDQYLFDEADERIPIDQGTSGIANFMGPMPANKVVELPPGRYRLRSNNHQVVVEPFEIKAGEETVIDFGG